MSGRRTGTKRKRGDSCTKDGGQGEPETLQILQQMHPNEGRSEVVDFDTIIANELNLPLQNSGNKPEIIRCGGDSISAHVPENLRRKIIQNEYINLNLLIKGAAELNEPQESLLGINENGRFIAQRPNNEKELSIEKWTDAFLIFSSIYVEAHPEQMQDILQYMFVIREAAGKYDDTMWRKYDEPFRLRQAVKVSPWYKINPDLWLRCFSTQLGNQHRQPPVYKSNPPPCIDFNKGFCNFTNCRYPHICSICFATQHGKWQCGRNQNTPFSPFRGSWQRRTPFSRRGIQRGQIRGPFRGRKH